MGRLITTEELTPSPSWYFEAIYINGNSGRYRIHWPNPFYPCEVCIHSDVLQENNKLKIEIRRFIEQNLPDTVIFDYKEMDYYKFFSEDHSWDKKWDVRNIWYRFHFEDEHSASVFALKFSEFVKPMTAWHPDHPEDEEWLKLPMEERRYT